MRPDEAKSDYYRRLAKKTGYVSRAAFKLIELNSKYGIFYPGQKVLDLGASPGGWSQVASRAVSKEGEVIAIDVRPIKINLDNVSFIKMNLKEEKPSLKGEDVVLSDLSPQVSGIWEYDQEIQWSLTEKALEIAEESLNRGGTFVCKVFDGEGVKRIMDRAEKSFTFVKLTKPKASRRQSSELYLVCKNFLKHNSATNLNE
ncbi:MAG: RlmE family RNA methyltransferase [Conexivisphaerales archaeon]